MPEPAPLPQGYAPMLDVRSVEWTSLRPHPENPRQGDVEVIGESVDENGVYKPMIVAIDGTVLAGNHLYEALGQRGGGRVDVVVIPVDPFSDKARRIMLADNRTADLGRYDDGLLLSLLDAMKDSDAGLVGSGYEPDDVEEIAAAIRRAEHTPIGYKADEPPSPLDPDSGGSPGGGPQPTPASAEGGGLAGDANRYESKGLRYITIEYPVAVYPAVVAALGEQRKTLGLDSNAEVVMRLLGVEGAL